ncbi:MAG: ribonuclease D [Candidatus Fonsibacter sp.]|nr:ribonuclease D [Candidatus Fonsibacter sp.]
MFKKNNHNFSFIKNNKELDQFIAKIKNKKKFFFDTEFDRRSTYKAIISIIVIFDGKNIGIIDCLENNTNFKKIFKSLNKKNNTLVIHSCRQDLEIFLSIVKKILFSVFDTQIAASLSGYTEVPSYKKLVHDFCKINLDKSLQKEDWLKRPINNERINYLINDVYYLKIISKKLNNKLIKKNKLKLFNKLIKKEIFKISYNGYPVIFKKKLGDNILNNQKLIRIISLRNKIAEKINLPKSWVFSDKEIIKNIKNEKISIISKNLKNIEIKNLTKLTKDFKKTFSKFN